MVSPLTVAVLDDHEVVLEGLRRTLGRNGADVVVAELSTEPFLAAVARTRPAVCLVDLRIAGTTTGLDVVAQCLRLAPGTKVAVLTSSEDVRSASAAIQAGASGYLIKDIGVAQLVERLRSVAAGDIVLDHRVARSVLRPTTGMLTGQELILLRWVAAGLTNREIAARMHLSAHTVKEYLSRVMRRLGTRSRAETVAKSLQLGLLEDSGGSPQGSP